MMLTYLLPLAIAAPQGGDLSTLHPSHALIYFEMADVQQVYQAYQDTAYAQIMGNPDCQRAVEKLTRLEPGQLEEPGRFIHGLLDQASDGMWSAIQPSLAELTTVSFSLSLEGMTPKQLFEGVHEDNFFGSSPLEDRLEKSLQAALVLDFRYEPSAASAFGFLQAISGSEVNEIQIDETSAKKVLVSGAWLDDRASGALQIGSRIIYVAGEDPETYLQRQLSSETNISFAQRFAAGDRHFEVLNEEGATYTRIFDFRSKLGEEVFPHMPYKEFYVPVLDLISSSLGSDLDMLLRGGQWRVSMRHKDNRGTFITQGFQPDLKLGPFDRIFTQHEIAPANLDYVHQDSVLASSMTLDKGQFKALLAHLFAMVGEDPFAELKREFNFSPEEDILEHLGPAWVASLPVSSIGISSLPGLSVWMELEDRRGLSNGLTKLQTVVAATSDGEFELKIQNYRDHTLYILRAIGSGDPLAALLKPTIVVFDDRVLLTPSSSHAKKEIRRIQKASDQMTLHRHVNRNTRPPGHVVEYSYADWGRILARVYTGAKQFLPVIEANIPPEAAAEIPVDLKHLPEAELFTRYFDPTYRHRTRVDGGVLIRVQSSVGMEMVAGTSAGLFLAFFRAAPSRPVPAESTGISPEGQPQPLREK